ncbi:MAG: 50S ribosomal protein L25 [Gemmatimonadaceae bacterium]|nr:50S ribosomal protein L25 [Gemmatimonadaceae bacterium]
MATANLSAITRNESGKGPARTLRSQGKIPATIYGHKRKPQSLAIDTRELEKLLGSISAENTVIDLAVGGTSSRTLIREIQRHPFKRQILHVDFQELVAGEMVIVRVPLILVGVSEGVRLGGGVLDQTMRDLEVRVDPANIPNHIDVNIDHLQIGQSIHIEEIKLPDGVEVMGDKSSPVCVVSAPRAAIEATVPVEGEEGAAAAEPEVIRKAKADDEEAEEKK